MSELSAKSPRVWHDTIPLVADDDPVTAHLVLHDTFESLADMSDLLISQSAVGVSGSATIASDDTHVATHEIASLLDGHRVLLSLAYQHHGAGVEIAMVDALDNATVIATYDAETYSGTVTRNPGGRFLHWVATSDSVWSVRISMHNTRASSISASWAVSALLFHPLAIG